MDWFVSDTSDYYNDSGHGGSFYIGAIGIAIIGLGLILVIATVVGIVGYFMSPSKIPEKIEEKKKPEEKPVEKPEENWNNLSNEEKKKKLNEEWAKKEKEEIRKKSMKNLENRNKLSDAEKKREIQFIMDENKKAYDAERKNEKKVEKTREKIKNMTLDDYKKLDQEEKLDIKQDVMLYNLAIDKDILKHKGLFFCFIYYG